MADLWQDVRLAVRMYLQEPGFTVVAVLILALGIGANTAIYTLVDAVALRPLPVTRPGELVRLGDNNACCVNTGLGGDTALFSYPGYLHLRDHTPEFAGLAAFQASAGSFSLRREGSAAAAQSIGSEFVSANYFATLGVPMAAGRALADDDDTPGAAPVAILGYRAWRDQFGLDPTVVGATFVVSGVPVTIVGITSPPFFGETLRPNPPALWLPLGIEPVLRGVRQGVVSASGSATSLLLRPDQNWLYIVGRLRPGVPTTTAQAKVSALLRDWFAAQTFLSDTERGQIKDQHVVITPAATGVSTLRTRYADALRVLGVVSALVLVIACANLANLLLARSQPFQFAMRAALGASRARLVREMLTSGLVLAVAGGLAGIAVAYGGVRVILSLAFRGAAYTPIDATPSPAILAFAALTSMARGHGLHRDAGVDHVEGQSDGRASWRRADDRRSICGHAAGARDSAGRRVARAHSWCWAADAESPRARASGIRLSNGRAPHRADRPVGRGLHRRTPPGALRSAAVGSRSAPRRREREPVAVQPDGGQQLVGRHQPRRQADGRAEQVPRRRGCASGRGTSRRSARACCAAARSTSATRRRRCTSRS